MMAATDPPGPDQQTGITHADIALLVFDATDGRVPEELYALAHKLAVRARQELSARPVGSLPDSKVIELWNSLMLEVGSEEGWIAGQIASAVLAFEERWPDGAPKASANDDVS